MPHRSKVSIIVLFTILDYIAATQLLFYLLIEFRDHLDELKQQDLFKKLNEIVENVPKTPNLLLTTLPILESITPLK
jgi:hypothetical protein